MAEKPAIYLDACCFIDMVKELIAKPIGDDRRADVWFIKQLTQANRDGEIDVYTAVLSIAECTHADGDISKPVRARFDLLLMGGQYVKLVQVTPFIAMDSRELRWKHGVALRGADAIHVASALDRKCDEFITTDGQAKKMAAKAALARLGLSVISAAETKCLPQKYRQLALPEPSDD